MISLYNHDYEMSVIGAMLQDSEWQKQLPYLSSEIMHDPGNMQIFATMKEIQGRKEPVDMLTLGNALIKKGIFDEVGGPSYLLDCVRYVPTTANTQTYINLLQNLMESRNAYQAATKFCKDLLEGNELAPSIDSLSEKLHKVAKPKGQLVRAQEIASRTFENIAKRSSGEITALKTGIPILDGMIGGFEKGTFTVIGARPGCGKSAISMQIAMNVCANGGRVIVCSKEMTDLQYGNRIISNLTGINGQRLMRGQIKEEEWAKIGDACNELATYQMAFTFDSDTVEDLRRMVQYELEHGGVDLVVIDYLQIMETTKRCGQRYEEVGTISRALKRMALDFEIPVLSPCQVSRESKGAVERMPKLSDLRESGNIEQDADMAIMMHIPPDNLDDSIPERDLSYFDQINNTPGHAFATMNVAKGRMCDTGKTFSLDFDKAHARFSCIERRP